MESAIAVLPPSTVDDRESDMGGGALYHDNRVRVDRVTR
jgi:hypothetical protein